MTSSVSPHIIEKLTKNKSNIDVEIVFGERDRGCAGLGICKIVIADQMSQSQKLDCKVTLCNLSIWEPITKKLLIEVRKDRICKNQEARFFFSHYFTVNEKYELSEELCASFGASSLSIRKGIYPILEFKDKFIILF